MLAYLKLKIKKLGGLRMNKGKTGLSQYCAHFKMMLATGTALGALISGVY